MKKLVLLAVVSVFSISYGGTEEVFTELKNTVGYIKVVNGSNYLIVESEDGAKLIRTKKDPESILKGSLGISKEDLKNIGE